MIATFLFFFNDTATTEIYTLSLHDALPIWGGRGPLSDGEGPQQAGQLLREPVELTGRGAGGVHVLGAALGVLADRGERAGERGRPVGGGADAAGQPAGGRRLLPDRAGDRHRPVVNRNGATRGHGPHGPVPQVRRSGAEVGPVLRVRAQVLGHRPRRVPGQRGDDVGDAGHLARGDRPVAGDPALDLPVRVPGRAPGGPRLLDRLAAVGGGPAGHLGQDGGRVVQRKRLRDRKSV